MHVTMRRTVISVTGESGQWPWHGCEHPHALQNEMFGNKPIQTPVVCTFSKKQLYLGIVVVIV